MSYYRPIMIEYIANKLCNLLLTTTAHLLEVY